RAHRRAARRRRAAAPLALLREVARPRIAPLHQETRQRAMDPLTVVEPALHEIDHVRDALRRVLREQFDLERPLRGLDDDDWMALQRTRLEPEPRRKEDGDEHENYFSDEANLRASS